MSEELTAEQIRTVFVEVLGREPSPAAVTDQLALPDLAAMLRLALDSDEFDERMRARRESGAQLPAPINVFHPDLAAYGPQPGTRSEDGAAIVGREGSLFLHGGSNAILDQYAGSVVLTPDWQERWHDLVLRRMGEIDSMGLTSALLIVPDKLAVYEERYPEPIEKVGPRPVERLLTDTELNVHYPLHELRAAAEQSADEDVFRRTDTHLTFRGNEALFHSLLDPLEIDGAPDLSTIPLHSYAIPGDLGVKFDPPIVSVVSAPRSLGAASISEDNRAEIEAVGGHIGSRRVYRNESASDQRVAVLFGDSFGFATPAYAGIAWFMAQVFREVHFIWVPFGWDPDYVRQVGAKVVLMQGAERFVARVPKARVEVARLAEEAMQRGRPVSVEAVFGG